MILLTQATEEKQKPEKKREHTRRPLLIGILSFLLALILMSALTIAVPVTFLRCLLTDHNVEVIVDHIVDTLDPAGISIPTEGGTQNIAGAILEFTSGVEGLDFITEEQINEVLLNDFVKQAATDILKQYGMSLAQGEEIFRLNAEQIYSYIEDNMDTLVLLAREAGYEGEIPIEENKEIIVSTIESAIGSEGISVESIIDSYGDAQMLGYHLRRAQLIFSDSTLYLVWGTVIFIAMLILFLNVKYISCFFRACGFPAIIVGGLYTLVSFSIGLIIAMIKIENELISEILNFIAGFSAALLADISVPMTAVGVAFIITSIIIAIIRRFQSKI